MAATVVSLGLQFRDAKHIRSEYHSFANLFHVVHVELQLLERMSGPESGLRPSIRLCEAATRSFKDPAAALEHGPAMSEFKSRIQADLLRVRVDPKYEQDAQEARDVIRQVIDDADLRVQETLARYGIHRHPRMADRETVRAMILAGAAEAEPSGRIAHHLQVHANATVRIPHGLPESVGRLGTTLAGLSGSSSVDVSVDPAEIGSFSDAAPAARISIRTKPLELNLLPTEPPTTMKSPTSAGTLRALIALISYIVSPEGDVIVDSRGGPLVLVRCHGGSRGVARLPTAPPI